MLKENKNTASIICKNIKLCLDLHKSVALVEFEERVVVKVLLKLEAATSLLRYRSVTIRFVFKSRG